MLKIILLRVLICRRCDRQNVIIHSDQGSTYASGYYQRLLDKHGMLCSINRKGECHVNTVAESFFATFMTELADGGDYRTGEQAKQSLFEYI